MELQNTVKEALTVLYHHPDESVRSQADRWLQEFQHKIEAWQVSDNLLHDASSNIEMLIFSSQTLRSKVQHDFEELPTEAFRPLRDSLYALLKKFSQGPPKVRTQISIGVAALAVHVSVEEWGDGGIINWISNEMKTHSECIPGLLELLTVLPEEVHSCRIAVRPERRRLFEKELTSSAETAFGLLAACLNFGELKDQVLESFTSWLWICSGVSASTLASHPLVQEALSCLNSEQHLEAAVNVVSVLIHYTTANGSGGVSAQMPLIHLIVPHVMGLKGQLRNSSKDDEDIKAVARLFADMGDSYVELIASGSEESMLIVQAMLEVASHPDYDISSMTYNFWHNLQSKLIRRDSYLSYESDALIEEEKKRRLHIFYLPFQMLVSLVNYRVEYPQDYDDLSEEDHKDFKHIRYAVGDVLVDATKVLGGDSALKILFMKLSEAVGNCSNGEKYKWQPVEAALYCIQAISKSISSQEVEILPQVMALLVKLPHQPQLLQTVCTTIGSYSKWINSAPIEHPILPPLVDILTKGMGTSEDTAAAATLAFKYICKDCRKQFSGSLDALFHIYHIAISGKDGYKVSADDSMHLVEALSVVITELPTEQSKKALELLCLPAVTPLQEMIAQRDAFQQIPARQITFLIDRLTCIFRNVKLPEVVADAVHRLWPLFKAIFDHRAWDMRTMESLCRACKCAVRTCGKCMGITIGAMLETIQTLYQQHSQSCFLYLSSEVIKIFGSDPSCSSYLQSLMENLFGHTTKLLTTLQEFTARPDIADDCYILASRCIRYCPDLFVPSLVFPSLVDCAMIGTTIQHREACGSILLFLSDVFDLGNISGGEKFRPIIDGVILPRGPTLTRILIASLAGALPPSRIDEISYALLALARSYGTRAVDWSRGIISMIPSTALTDVESSRFIKSLADAESGSDSSLASALEEFSDVCRRNKAVQDTVQGVLRPVDLHLAAGI